MNTLAPDITEPVVARIYTRIRRLLESVLLGDGLKAKVFRGGAWLGGGSVFEQAARFGRNMVLTRLLAPEAFGAMAIVLSATSLLQSFTDIGVREGLVQNPQGAQDRYVNTAWWLGFGRALSLAAVLFAVAPLAASFYGNAELTALLRLSTLGVILGGAESPRAMVAMKEMKFGRLAAIANLGGICGVAITVILSFVIRDVWALVIGACTESAARCILSYVLCPYVPSLRWNREAARELLRFSKGLFGLSFLNLIFARADIFVLAKLYSPAALGLYTMAIYLVQTPTNLIMNTLGQALLPAYSQIQGDTGRTNRILIRVTSMIALLGLPALALVVICGRSLLTLVYGPRYGAAVVPLMLAGCVAVFNLANGQLTMVFYARGLPQLHRRCVIISATVVSVLVYPASKWLGFAGGQLACVIAIVAGYLFQISRTSHLTGLKSSEYAKTYLLPALVSLSVVAFCLATRRFDIPDPASAEHHYWGFGLSSGVRFVFAFPSPQKAEDKSGSMSNPYKGSVDLKVPAVYAGAAAYSSKRLTYFTNARHDYVSELSANANAKILEIGCGGGETGALALLKGKCGSYYGVEMCEAAGEMAKERLTEVLVGDIERLDPPWNAETFDALILSEVLEHLSDPWATLRKLLPTLKSGGLVFASSPNISHYSVIAALLRGEWTLTDVGLMDRTHLRWFTPKTYQEMFESCGYCVDIVREHSPLSRKARSLNFLSLADSSICLCIRLI